MSNNIHYKCAASLDTSAGSMGVGSTLYLIGMWCVRQKDFDVCALKLNLNSIGACIITIYRAISGNFNSFLNELGTILRRFYVPTLEYIICGDINIDYLANNENKTN